MIAIKAEVEQPVDKGNATDQQEEESYSPVRRVADCSTIANWCIGQHMQSWITLLWLVDPILALARLQLVTLTMATPRQSRCVNPHA